MRPFLFYGLLIILYASCRTTLPPSIMLDNSIDTAYWHTSAIKVKRFTTNVTITTPTETLNAIAKDSIVESITNVGTAHRLASVEFIKQDEVDSVINNNYKITNSSGNQCTDCFEEEIIYRRKLHYGDVIYLTTGEHWKIASQQFLPTQNVFRIPIRRTTEGINSLKDYEKAFLNFIISTHNSLVIGDYSDAYPGVAQNGGPNKITNLVNAYRNNRERIWNALMENIYYQYSNSTGYSIVVDFSKIEPFFIDEVIRPGYRHHYVEIISRPVVLKDEIETLASKSIYTNSDTRLKDDIYYDNQKYPSAFYLSSIELNGVKMNSNEIENKSWNIQDWKHSGIAYLLKYDGNFNIPINRLLLKKQATTNAGNYKLIVDEHQTTKALSSPVPKLFGVTENEGSRFIMPTRATLLFQTVIYISNDDLRLIKPSMLKKRSLRKYFHLK